MCKGLADDMITDSEIIGHENEILNGEMITYSQLFNRRNHLMVPHGQIRWKHESELNSDINFQIRTEQGAHIGELFSSSSAKIEKLFRISLNKSESRL